MWSSEDYEDGSSAWAKKGLRPEFAEIMREEMAPVVFGSLLLHLSILGQNLSIRQRGTISSLNHIC